MNKPTHKDEQDLLSLDTNGKDVIEIEGTNKVYKIGWMKGYTLERLSKLELKEGYKEGESESDKVIENRAKILSKAVSLCILNGISIFFFHWIFWRYLYYIKGYSFNQLEKIIQTAKKKVPAVSWYASIVCIKGMKITAMSMTKEEQERIQVALTSE